MATMDPYKQKLNQMEKIIDYSFSDKRLGLEALQMKAPVVLTMIHGARSSVNKHAEVDILGNSISASVQCREWFKARNPAGQTKPSPSTFANC